jgi:hypothetical protein
MNTALLAKISLIILWTVALFSCEKPLKEEDKVFHGGPESQGIGGLSFALYKDGRYQIINSGGIGWHEYDGSYTLSGDTITLNNLDKKSSVKHNRLLVYRYDEQDSTYWEWKYSHISKSYSDKTLGSWSWESFKWKDLIHGQGDVYQLDTKDKPLKAEYHFIIQLDS